MKRWAVLMVLAVGTCLGPSFAQEQRPTDKTAADRGRGLVRGAPPLNPPLWSKRAYAGVWKQWGLKEVPADYDLHLRDRYGLHEAPFANDGLPMGLHLSSGLLGKGIATDCLLCHAGRVAGQTIIGLGNSTVDVQGLFDELFSVEAPTFKFPVALSHARGTIDPISPVAFLFEFRDLDLNLGKSVKLPYSDHLVSAPPAWWLLKKKKTRNWTGLIDANSIRVDMPNILSPFNSGAYIRGKEAAFADIHQFILGLEAPRFPFPIDTKKAAQGQELFTQHCARCHGTYGPGGSYPNKVVPLDTIGTDPQLAEAITKEHVDHFNKSWLGREITPKGEPIHARVPTGYQAPPLDGIWATAPYFHNGSVPTVYHVLNSQARPKVFTRSYRTDRDAYDTEKVGWIITPVDSPHDSTMPAIQRRRIYDTTRPGQANSGHTFGDALTEDERMAVIEYLKSL